MNRLGEQATEVEITKARQIYGSDDVEIDDNARASRDDEEGTGTWVQGWLWVERIKNQRFGGALLNPNNEPNDDIQGGGY